MEQGASASDVGLSDAHATAYQQGAGEGQVYTFDDEGKYSGTANVEDVVTGSQQITDPGKPDDKTSTELNNQQNEVNTAEKELEEIKKTGTEAEIKAAQTKVTEKKTLLEKFLGKISSIKEKIMASDSEETTKNKKRIEELLKEAGGDPYSLPGSKRRELE